MKKFTVFHVDGERGLRGGERQLVYLACALRERGHRNVVVCRADSPLSDRARAARLEVRTLPFCCEWDPYTAFRLSLWTRCAENPVLHAHTGHAASLVGLASFLHRVPTVLHRRVDFSLNTAASGPLKYGRAERVVAVSEAVRRILVDDGVDARKVSVVADGLPADEEECLWTGTAPHEFAPPSWDSRQAARQKVAKEFGVEPKAPWVGNLAALVPHKDHDTLIAAALIAVLKRPDLVFLIAGEGPEEERLLAQIKKMGLLGRVLLLGHRDDPVSLLKCLDVFVLSSSGEGMGSVLLEAAACGVPVAATRAGGIPEIIVDRETGLLCPPRDPETLAQNIETLIADQKLARRLALQGIKNLPRFGLKRMAEQMETIYEALA
ncbi:MAG: glycosyltransferase [Elusimicrobia bacterium]|nr:glycosyltransferase [Elusimicrobiota bacterium]